MFPMQIQLLELAVLLSCAGLFKLAAACSGHACVFSGVSSDVGLVAHNSYRDALGVQSLQLNPELSTSASKCAQFYCQNYAAGLKPNGTHCPYRADRRGENMFMSGYGDAYLPQSPEYLTQMASDYWDASHTNVLYYISQPNGLEALSSYSQMVWAPASQVGFGVCTCEKDLQIVVAHYDEAQNILGQRVNCQQQNSTDNETTELYVSSTESESPFTPETSTAVVEYASFMIFQHSYFNNYFSGFNLTIHVPTNGCLNLAPEMQNQISSVYMQGVCFVGWSGADCQGQSIKFPSNPTPTEMGACNYHDITSCPLEGDEADSPFSQYWNDRIVSFSICKESI